MMWRRSITGLLAACTVLASLLLGAAPGQTPAVAAGTIKIGALFPLTGDEGAFGSDSLAAIRIAANIFNAQGGVKGQKVVIVPSDVTTPDQAQSEARRLVTQEHINVIMGTTLSLLGIPASAQVDRFGGLYWDVTDASTVISGRGLKHVFQFSPHASESGRSGAQFAATSITKLLHKSRSQVRVGVTNTNEAYGTQVGAAMAATAKKLGLNVVLHEAYDPNVTDLSPLILKLKSNKVDVVLQSTFQADAILFNKQSRQLGFNPVVISALGYDNPATAKALGKCIDGVFNTSSPQYSSINPRKLTQEARRIFVLYGRQYKARTGRPTSVDSDEAFSGAWAFLKHVLAPVGSTDSVDALAAKARTLNIRKGGMPNGFGLKFNAHQYNKRGVVAITQYQNVKEVSVAPRTLAIEPIQFVPRPPWSTLCTS